MATEATAGPTSAAPAAAQPPASGTTAPAPAKPSVATTRNDRASQFAEAFGGQPQFDAEPGPDAGGLTAPQPSAAPTDLAAPATGQPGQSEATETATAAEEVATQPTDAAGQEPIVDELLGAELLADLDRLGLPESATPQRPAVDQQAVPTTEADVEKLLNPDGQASIETKYKAAQSMIGRQGTELGTLRQENKQFRSAIAELQKGFEFDQASGTLRATPAGIVDLAANLDPASVNAELSQRGLKMRLVPLDDNGNVSVEANPHDAMLRQVVNQMYPGDDLTFEEKLAEVQSTRNTELVQRIAAATLRQEAEHAQRHLQLQQRQVENDQRIQGFFTNLKKLPYFKELAPAIQAYNAWLPKEVTGQKRLDLLYRLAQGTRLAQQTKKLVADAYRRGRNETAGIFEAGGIGGVGPSTQVDVGAGAQTANPHSQRAAVTRKALSAAFGG